MNVGRHLAGRQKETKNETEKMVLTYYVDPWFGKDSNKGDSFKNPFQTFAHCMAVALNGDGRINVMIKSEKGEGTAKRSPNKRKRQLKRAAVR